MWLAHAFALGLRSETLAESCERSNNKGETSTFTDAGHQHVKTGKKQSILHSVDLTGFNSDCEGTTYLKPGKLTTCFTSRVLADLSDSPETGWVPTRLCKPPHNVGRRYNKLNPHHVSHDRFNQEVNLIMRPINKSKTLRLNTTSATRAPVLPGTPVRAQVLTGPRYSAGHTHRSKVQQARLTG